MKPRQVPIFLYWRVENVQFWINSISHPGWLSCILNFTLLYFESIFLKIVHQKGLFDAIKENPNFPNCRRILNIYWQWLLIMHQYLQVYQHASFLDYLIHKFGHSCPLISFSYLEINHCHLHFVPSQEQKTTSLNYHTSLSKNIIAHTVNANMAEQLICTQDKMYAPPPLKTRLVRPLCFFFGKCFPGKGLFRWQSGLFYFTMPTSPYVQCCSQRENRIHAIRWDEGS